MNDNYLQGMVADMSNSEYHSQVHIGSSGFKLLERSPLHFWHASPLNPDRKRRDPTPMMIIGTAWHAAIFEPQLFAGQFVRVPDGIDRRSKDGKALFAEIEASKRTPLAAATFDDVQRMAEAALSHPVTRVVMGLPDGMAEASIFWVDPETGAPCRIRPDYHVPPCSMFPHGLIIDGKSNDDSSPAGFASSCFNSEMYFQAAFYSDGFQHHYGTSEPPVFAWLSQERDAPYATAYYSAPADLVQFGREKYRRLLRVFADCLHTGVWPGYPLQVNPLELPGWAVKQVQEGVAA